MYIVYTYIVIIWLKILNMHTKTVFGWLKKCTSSVLKYLQKKKFNNVLFLHYLPICIEYNYLFYIGNIPTTYWKIFHFKMSAKYNWIIYLLHIAHNIQVDLSKRLGNLKNGIADIKNHLWFRAINWLQIINQKMDAPYKPDNIKFKMNNKEHMPVWKNEKEFFDF